MADSDDVNSSELSEAAWQQSNGCILEVLKGGMGGVVGVTNNRNSGDSVTG